MPLSDTLKRIVSEERLRSARTLRGRWRRAQWSIGSADATHEALADYRLRLARRQPLRELSRRFDDPRLQEAFDTWAASERLEYLYRYPCGAWIDPACGFVIGERDGPLLPSLIESDFAPTPSEAAHLERLPSPARYLLAKQAGLPRVVRLPGAVSLRALSEANYWHFHNDVLSKVRLLDEIGIPTQIPLIVGESLYRLPFFQQAIRRPGLAGRTFVAQDSKTYIAVTDQIVFGAAMGHERTNFEYIRKLLGAPAPDLSSERRIFLARGSGSRRRLVNQTEIAQVVHRYGFETVDTGGMEIGEQIALFAGARYVIGAHGAGLVNLIYRNGAPLGLIELFGPRHIAPHYYWLAQDYGYDYDALVGSETAQSERDHSFLIDPKELEDRLRKMLG